MADELDPILEARLRGVLKSEADAVPFTLRADTVRRVGAERRRARNTQRFTMFAAAAVVVVAVAGLALSFAMRSPSNVAASPTPASSGAANSPNLAGLPSYDELALSAQAKTELGRQEGQAGPQGGQWPLSVPQGTRTVEVVVACTGTSLDVGTAGANLPVKWLIGAQCNGQPVDLRAIGGGALASDQSPFIVIGAGAGTTFRLIVRDEAGAKPDPNAYPAPTPDANGLATYDALKSQLEAGGDAIASMTGEHLTSETGTAMKTWDLGTLVANQGQIASSCFGESVTMGFGDGTTFAGSMEARCDPIITLTSLPTNAASGVTPHLMVQALPSVRWRVVAGIVPTLPSPTGSAAATPSASPLPSSSTGAGLPGPDALLASLPAGALQVGDASRGTATLDQTVVLTDTGHRTSLAVAAVCSGGGSFSVDKASNTSEGQELSAMDCDGAIHWVTWSGADAQNYPSVQLHMGAGMTWSAIVADVSRVPRDPAASPAPAGQLPTVAEVAASGSNLGVNVATQQDTDGSDWTSASFGDIHTAGAVQVRLACLGNGGASLAVSNASDTRDELGRAICDGTVQSFTWIRSGGLADANRAVVTSDPGVTWSAVVSDATASLVSTTHTTPAVACGTPNLKTSSPPVAALYQGTTKIGAIGYFTSGWGTTSVDGVPTTTDKANEATSAPFTLRIAGDVCATSWVVKYGSLGKVGDVVTTNEGVLANQQPEAGADWTTTKNRENRIDIAGLPSGDWMVEVDLTFVNGSASGVIRVHVP